MFGYWPNMVATGNGALFKSESSFSPTTPSKPSHPQLLTNEINEKPVTETPEHLPK